MNHFILFFSLILCINSISQEVLLHAHNDYLQKFPLETALNYKANSIEVDVAWFQGEIKVSHLNFALKNKPDLEKLYLNKMKENQDRLGSVMFLMIDIKSGGEDILIELNEIISDYDEIFASRNENDKTKIKVIVSGAANRQKLIENKALNYLFADGKPININAKLDSKLMPIISANYSSLSKPDRISLIEKAHQQGKKVRFWNTKDSFKSWEKLLKLKVDFISVDHIEKFSSFIVNY